MTDLRLNSANDLHLTDGQIVIIDTKEEFIQQRLLNRLRTFTGTLFTNINYGIDGELMFEKGTQALLDLHLKDIIAKVPGIISLVSFTSTVGSDRRYLCEFTYKIETGEIIGIRGLAFGQQGLDLSKGIWNNGYWDYSGQWDNTEIWGS